MTVWEQFQSTRPQGARRHSLRFFNGLSHVSIHAPAGGATVVWLLPPGEEVVSIHAPAGGATLTTSMKKVLSRFQSTRPQGARLEEDAKRVEPVMVSIHAPAGGATQVELKGQNADMFQSTRPQGARRIHHRHLPGSSSFNPRARRGRDLNTLVKINDASRVSIHAPAGGATSR